MRYAEAGVDLSRSDELKARIAAAVESTHLPAVRPLPAGFAGLIAWPQPGPRQLLAASMDGVGTKLHVALAAGRVADAAADLVYHGANDLLVHGARPLAFLDYIAQETLDREVVLAAIEGLARGCREVGAVLLGGETAEMPDTYRPGVIDVAGCMLGTVEAGAVLDGTSVRAGDRVLGLASSGLHTNGFSLARRVLATCGAALDARLPGGAGESIGEALLAPHRWYGPALGPELASERSRVRALAHVTGGGIEGNFARVLPAGTAARIDWRAWPRPAIFRWLMDAGEIPEEEARRAFNLGIGMVVVCAESDRGGLARDLEAAGERVYEVGEIVPGEPVGKS